MFHERQCPKFEEVVDVALRHIFLAVEEVSNSKLKAVFKWLPVVFWGRDEVVVGFPIGR